MANLPKETVKQAPNSGLQDLSKFFLHEVNAAGVVVNTIEIDATIAQGHTVKLREFDVCKNGVPKKIMLLATDFY